MRQRLLQEIRQSVADCMATYTVDYSEMVSALASITAEVCIEQSNSRSHAIGCEARIGRFLCTCKIGSKVAA